MKVKGLLKSAWQIVWRNPILWLFGFLAGFLANNEINLIVINLKRFINWINQIIILRSFKLNLGSFLNNINYSSKDNYRFFIIIFFALILIYLSFKSQIAIINAVVKRSFSFKILLGDKNNNPFYRVLFIYLIFWISILIFFFILGIPFIQNLPIPILIYIIVFILLVLLFSFISRFATLFLVIKKNNFLESIKNSFSFFFNNFFLIIKTLIILTLVVLLVGLIALLFSIGMASPFIFLLNLSLKLNFHFVYSLISIIYSFCLLGLILIINSIISSWQISVWILLFQKIDDNKINNIG